MVRAVSQRTHFNTQTLKFGWKVEDLLRDGSVESGFFDAYGFQWKFRLDKVTANPGSRSPHAISITLVNVTSSSIKTFIVQSCIEDRNKKARYCTNYIFDLKIESEKEIWRLEYASNLTEAKGGELITDGSAGGINFASALTSIYESRTPQKENKIIQTSINSEAEASLEKLAFDFRRLLDAGTDADITLKCGDRSIAAHRSVLSARSKVLAAMLSTDMTESLTGIIEISDMTLPILDQLVQFIYSAKLSDLSVDTASELYTAGDKYAIDSLKAQCSVFLKKNLAEGNVYSVAALADTHSDAHLREWAVVYIIQNELMRKNDAWFQFCDDHPRVANEILNRVYRKVRCGQSLNNEQIPCYVKSGI